MKKEQISILHQSCYCRQCGSRMLEDLIGAENYYEEYPECGRIYPYSRYSKGTGKRQYVYKYTCPNKKWFGNHDSFIEDKVITC